MYLCRQNITENKKYMLQCKITVMVLKEVKKKKPPNEIMGVEEKRVIIANTYWLFQAVYTY